MKFALHICEANISHAAGVFHISQKYFTCPKGEFRWKKRASRRLALFFLEAPPGFGPGDKGFADPCLTTWLWRHIQNRGIIPRKDPFVNAFLKILLLFWWAIRRICQKGGKVQRMIVLCDMGGIWNMHSYGNLPVCPQTADWGRRNRADGFCRMAYVVGARTPNSLARVHKEYLAGSTPAPCIARTIFFQAILSP